MRVWRVCLRKYAGDPVDGEGARLFGGRWSSVGLKVVYTSGSVSLATLEAFVHYDSDLVPNDLALVAVDISDDVAPSDLPDAALPLPRNWRNYPAPPELQKIGDAWIRAGASAVFKVPSAISPEEANYLLNPAHRDFAKISYRIERPFGFDPRLLRKKR